MFEDIRNIRPNKKNLRDYGLIMGVILLVIGIIFFYQKSDLYNSFFVISGAFFGFGWLMPIVLKPLYLVWMLFAIILGWIMTKLILTLIFFLVVTPIGFISKISGKNLLDLNYSKHESYWNYRDEKFNSNQNNEKQF